MCRRAGGPALYCASRWTAHLDPAIPAVMVGDAVRKSQVLVHLLSNAVKFSQRSHIQVRATPGGTGPGFVCVRLYG